MSALLNCPMCGSTAEYAEGMDEGGRFFAVQCSGCGCGSGKHYPLMDDARPNAANEWNRRTPPPLPTREEVAAVICSHQMSHNSKGEALFPSFAADDPLVVDECDIYLSLADAVLRLLGGEKK